uniref:Sieve element occlusion n=1 Tax=Kalanchoe fedtschenkoi TaxID=63787 RepID=A0A7N0U8I1_KALFE
MESRAPTQSQQLMPQAHGQQQMMQPALSQQQLMPQAHGQQQMMPPALSQQQLMPPAHGQQQMMAPALGQKQLMAPALTQQQLVPPAQSQQQLVPPAQRPVLPPALSQPLIHSDKPVMPSVHSQQLIRGDRTMFAASDDNVMTRQILATHTPDGREIDVRPIIHLVEEIFHRANPSIEAMEPHAIAETLADKAHHAGFGNMLDTIAYTVDRVGCEMVCKCTGGDAHGTTIAVLNMLACYSWDAKLVLALSAFAVNYGQFWLVAQFYSTNQLAKSIAILKQLPELMEHSNLLQPRFDAVRGLIKAMIDVTKCIVEFKGLPHQYIGPEVPEYAAAMSHIPITVYWTIRGAIACVSQIAGLTGLGHEYIASTTEAWELSSLAHKVTNMYNHLMSLLGACHKHIEGKMHLETYQLLLHLFEMTHIDNMKVLRALLNQRDEPQPLVDGATKRRVNLDVLRRKMVLLLISDLDISNDELSILEQIYNESRTHLARGESQYELVWMPIVDQNSPWTEAKQKQFELLQASMPWYTVHHPSLIDKAVVQFVKDVWSFGKKPILVVLDPQGRVACPNALHMMWIWGSAAFPFTTAREEALWKEELWRLELLVDGLDPQILTWIAEDRHICIYGGEDLDWIRKFTTTANAVAQAAGIPLGMVYVGKSNPKERVRRNIAAIRAENLSHYWPELSSIWYFWVRIESMWYSKMQLNRTIENDPIMQEIMTLMSYDGSDGGWAIFTKGSGEMVRGKGGQFLTCLTEFNAWKEDAAAKGFMPALKDHLLKLHTPHHCNRLVLPGAGRKIPERIVCSECGRVMERFLMYQCCDE